MDFEKRKIRYRKSFPFQLDLNNLDEHEIAEQIIELKQERSFSKTIRDGIRLICDLRNGHIEVLKELFPWVLEQLQTEETPQIEPIDAFKPVIERLENLFSQQNTAQTSATSGNLNRDIPLSKKGETSKNEPEKKVLSPEEQYAEDYKNGELSVWNSLIKMNIGFDGDTRNLDDKVVLYGLNKPTDGLPHIRPIPEKKLAGKHQYLLLEKDDPRVKAEPQEKAKEEKQPKTDGPKTIEVSQFMMPNFDNQEA